MFMFKFILDYLLFLELQMLQTIRFYKHFFKEKVIEIILYFFYSILYFFYLLELYLNALVQYYPENSFIINLKKDIRNFIESFHIVINTLEQFLKDHFYGLFWVYFFIFLYKFFSFLFKFFYNS